MEENQNTQFDEKAAKEDSKIDAVVSVVILLVVTAIIVFWVSSQ
jgi:flagellar basal body-associated protein FliL|tara:strand:+ start:12994 stop:13125 length:132 start_codon:yes stop_codon:yes gene_type:complete